MTTSGSAPRGAGRRTSIRLPTDPWTLAAIVCLFAGIVLLVVAWYDISGTANLYEQMPYLVSAGFSGLAFIIVGSALIVAGRNDRVERRLAQLVDSLTEAMEPVADPIAERSEQPANDLIDASADAFLVTPGSHSYHRPGCLLLRDKDVHTVTAAELADRREADALTPCPVCDPALPEVTPAP